MWVAEDGFRQELTGVLIDMGYLPRESALFVRALFSQRLFNTDSLRVYLENVVRYGHPTHLPWGVIYNLAQKYL